eukprot:365843-Chlamydomonas_euryale.AAC.5
MLAVRVRGRCMCGSVAVEMLSTPCEAHKDGWRVKQRSIDGKQMGDAWTDRWMGGQTDGRTDEKADARKDGQTHGR